MSNLAGALDLGIAFQPARVLAEIPLAILPAALRVAATSRGAFIDIDFLTDLA